MASPGSASRSVVEFAGDATGDATPLRTIVGSLTTFVAPRGVVVAADGTLYVADTFKNVIDVFAPGANGNVAPDHVIAGAATGLSDPRGLVLIGNDELLVGSGVNNSLRIFDASASGNVAPKRVIAGASTGLSRPWYPVIDHAGNIYAANDGNSTITEYPAGANGDVAPIRTIVGPHTGLDVPYLLAIDSEDRLVVGNIGGEDEDVDESVEVFRAALSLTDVSPSSGSVNGGATVTIHGYGFAAGDSVTLGGTPATRVTVVDSNTLTATVPAHAAGKVAVVVTSADDRATLAAAYTYTASLALTGVDTTPTGVAAGALLVFGFVLLVVRRRLRRRGITAAG